MNRHRTDSVSLAFALAFLTIVAWWLVARTFHLVLPGIGWFVAAALILLGILGLLGALRTGRSSTSSEAAPPAEPDAAASDPTSGAATADPDGSVTAPPATDDGRP